MAREIEKRARLETALWQALAQRELLGVAQLFITGYQPLAFVTGQLLHLVAPIATLLGIHFLSDWAERLSQADVIRDPYCVIRDS